MPPDDANPALQEADQHRTAYNEALSRGERAFGAEYDALRRAYPSPDGEDPSEFDAGAPSANAPSGDQLAISLAAVDIPHQEAVREAIETYAADEDGVWRDWDAILAAHPDSDLFERLDDPANDLILAAAWARSSPYAQALIERNPALLTDPAAIEAAIVEAKKLFIPASRGHARRLSPPPNERTMPMPSLPPGATARDRWIAQADQARSKMHAAHAGGDTRKAELWSAEERRLLGLAYGRAV